MNLYPLYRLVYNQEEKPSEAALIAFCGNLAALPDFMFTPVFAHYVSNRPLEDIAAELGAPLNLVKTWMGHGIYILQLWARGEGE